MKMKKGRDEVQEKKGEKQKEQEEKMEGVS